MSQFKFKSNPLYILAVCAAFGLLVVPEPAVSEALLTNEQANADASTVEDNVYYRWIDQQGRVQYTDFEPVGVPSQQVQLDSEAAAAVGLQAPPLMSAENEFQPDPFHDQDQQILPIEHIGPCADARQQLAVLHTELPVYLGRGGAYRSAWRGDAYRGERQYLTDEDRSAAIAATQARVLKHCSDPAAFDAEVEAFKARVNAR